MKIPLCHQMDPNENRSHMFPGVISEWGSFASVLGLLFIDHADNHLKSSFLHLGGVILICALFLTLTNLYVQKVGHSPSASLCYCAKLAARSILYMGISALVYLHIQTFPLLSWQSIFCCGIFIGNAERLIYQNYFHPTFTAILLSAFQAPIISVGLTLPNRYANILALVLVFHWTVHIKKIYSLYNLYASRNDFEARLEEDKKKVNTLLDLLPGGVAKFDKNLNYLQVNKYITDLSGLPAKSIIDNHFGFSGKNSPDIEKIRDFASGSDQRFEIILSFFDCNSGKQRRHQTYWQKLSNEEIISVSVDIEDLMTAKESLLQEREFSLTILNAVPDPISVKNAQHSWIFGNQSFSRLLGMEHSEFLQKTDYDVFPRDLAEPFWKKDEEALNAESFSETVEVLVNAEMKERTLLVKRTPYTLPNKQRILISVTRDITDRRRLELDLLEKSKLANIGQMAAGVAHEINNPLAVIGGKAELLIRQIEERSDITKEKALADLTKIVTTVGRIAKIVKSMQVLAHNHDKSSFELMTLEDFMQNCLGICYEKLKASGVKLSISITQFVQINIDPTQMGQVVINLVNNAFDAVMDLPEEQRWISIESQLNADTPNFVDITVTDGGSGIPMELRDKIMTPFFTTKKVGKGTGLGLSLSKTIVQNHGGSFLIDYKHPNTRFVIQIPTFAPAK